MNTRIISPELKLIPYYPNPAVALAWYQDSDVCKQVDNIDFTYTLDRLNAMYNYLSTHGDCYYIEYRGVLVGDMSLRDNCEVALSQRNTRTATSDDSASQISFALHGKREWSSLKPISTPSTRRAKPCF